MYWALVKSSCVNDSSVSPALASSRISSGTVCSSGRRRYSVWKISPLICTYSAPLNASKNFIVCIRTDFTIGLTLRCGPRWTFQGTRDTGRGTRTKPVQLLGPLVPRPLSLVPRPSSLVPALRQQFPHKVGQSEHGIVRVAVVVPELPDPARF